MSGWLSRVSRVQSDSDMPDDEIRFVDSETGETLATLNVSQRPEEPVTRPVITIDPAVRFGEPTLNHTRLSAKAVGGCIAAGDSVAFVAEQYNVTRADVLVACWYLGTHGRRTWRTLWRRWAEQVYGAMWRAEPDWDAIPDPPGQS